MRAVGESERVNDVPGVVQALLDSQTPHAAHFIVTVYGDIVEPRGGTLWMGTLIEVCSAHGISESLVRTAVSRLVASGRLIGERNGRRSFYRLTAAARREFTAAARVLFFPVAAASGWLLWANAPDELNNRVWVRVGDGVAMAPDRADLERPEGLLFRMEAEAGLERLPAFAAKLWNLDAIAEGYRQVISRFAPVLQGLEQGQGLDGAEALALRLMLVDQYRAVALRDPRLPSPTLPDDWTGQACRQLFIRLYRLLSPAAETHIGLHFRDADGFLLAHTEGSQLRLERLAQDEKA